MPCSENFKTLFFQLPLTGSPELLYFTDQNWGIEKVRGPVRISEMTAAHIFWLQAPCSFHCVEQPTQIFLLQQSGLVNKLILPTVLFCFSRAWHIFSNLSFTVHLKFEHTRLPIYVPCLSFSMSLPMPLLLPGINFCIFLLNIDWNHPLIQCLNVHFPHNSSCFIEIN